MKFDEVVSQILEAKGTKPGERYQRAMDSEGPGEFSASPVGKSNFNPEEKQARDTGPADLGGRDIRDIRKILTMSLLILKNEPTFDALLKGVLNGFKRERKQINYEDEKFLKSIETTKEKIQKRINEFSNKLAVAQGKDTYVQTVTTNVGGKKSEKNISYDASVGNEIPQEYIDEWQDKLNSAKATLESYEKKERKVRNKIAKVKGVNKELSDEGIEKIRKIVIRSADDLIDESLLDDIVMGDVVTGKFDAEVKSDPKLQALLLNQLQSDDPNINPLLKIIDEAERRYENSVDYIESLRHGDEYNVSVETLYNNLPLTQLSKYFYNTILKYPKLKLADRQKAKIDTKLSRDDIFLKLDDAKNSEKKFEKIKPEVIKFIENSPLGDGYKKELIKIANGPFIGRSGASSPIRIASSLSSSLNESFDSFASKVLQSYIYDEDDYKLDLMEILENKSKCDGPTKKASSDRKGKKWQKCAKQPDGSYERIHWGDSNARVTGKNGNTKRKKSFRARHNCDNAKQGSSQQAACQDW